MGNGPDESRRFFLAEEPRDGRARLAPEEAHHALRVLRLRAGDSVLGLDGRGSAWPLVLPAQAAGRRAAPEELELEVCGQSVTEPAPGAPGAALPWIEVAVSLPRAGRAEEMVDRLTQLGVAAIRPLACHRTPPAARELSASRFERLRRAAAQACKQSIRLWTPTVHPIAPLQGAAEGDPFADWSAGAFGEVEAASTLAAWARAQFAAQPGPRPGRFGLAIGPEGGWEAAESDSLRARDLHPVRIGAHVLRIETAAEAALAIAAQAALDER